MNGADGIAEMWLDGIQKLSYSNVNFGTQSGWTSFLSGSNQRYLLRRLRQYIR